MGQNNDPFAPARAIIAAMRCSRCGGHSFMEGPKDGLAINVQCLACGHWYNATPNGVEDLQYGKPNAQDQRGYRH